MRSILSVGVLWVLASSLYALDNVPTYEESLEQFQQVSAAKPSPFSVSDREIMVNSSKALAKAMPNPGLPIGQVTPEFKLKNANGDMVSLEAELKKGPVVLVFYRGAWCPYCNIHLNLLQQNIPEFEKYGAQLIAITPQQPNKSADQIEAKGYPFQVLSDLDSKVMKAYNLYYELSDNLVTVYKKTGLDLESFNGSGRNVLPVPGTFVIDQSGVIRAMQAQTDYKSRMEPADVIEALKIVTSKK